MTKSGVQQQHLFALSVIAGDRLRSWSLDCAEGRERSAERRAE
jgi:hypothetical protein